VPIDKVRRPPRAALGLNPAAQHHYVSVCLCCHVTLSPALSCDRIKQCSCKLLVSATCSCTCVRMLLHYSLVLFDPAVLYSLSPAVLWCQLMAAFTFCISQKSVFTHQVLATALEPAGRADTPPLFFSEP